MKFLRTACAEVCCWFHGVGKMVHLDKMCKIGVLPGDTWSTELWILGSWGPIALFAHLSSEDNNSIHFCSSGLQWRWFWPKGDIWWWQEMFFHHNLGTEGVPPNLVVGSRDVPKNPAEEGHPDKAMCPRCLSWGPGDEAWRGAQSFAAVSSCRETPSRAPERLSPPSSLWSCWGRAVCSELRAVLFSSSRQAHWGCLVYVTLCTNTSWLLFRAVKTMISV